MMKKLFASVLALALAACATTTPPVSSYAMLKEGGIYQTSGYGLARDDSEKAANYNATQTCVGQKKTAVISKIDTSYQGTIGEDVNKTVTMVSALLKSTTGKNYGSVATDKDYKTVLEFKCQ